MLTAIIMYDILLLFKLKHLSHDGAANLTMVTHLSYYLKVERSADTLYPLSVSNLENG